MPQLPLIALQHYLAVGAIIFAVGLIAL